MNLHSPRTAHRRSALPFRAWLPTCFTLLLGAGPALASSPQAQVEEWATQAWTAVPLTVHRALSDAVSVAENPGWFQALPAELLKELGQRTPGGVQLSHIALNRRKLSLKGHCLTLGTAGDLAGELERSKLLKNVEIERSEQERRRGEAIYAFHLTAEVRTAGDERQLEETPSREEESASDDEDADDEAESFWGMAERILHQEQRLRDEIPQLLERLERARSRYAPHSKLDEAMLRVQTLAVSSGLDVLSFAKGGRKQNGLEGRMSIRIQARGGHSEFLSFLQLIADEKQILQVPSMELKRKRGAQLEGKLRVDVFWSQALDTSDD